jgi:hypothetical protein
MNPPPLRGSLASLGAGCRTRAATAELRVRTNRIRSSMFARLAAER